MSMCLISCAIVLLAVSGVPAVLMGRRSCTGAVVAAAFNVLAGVVGLAGLVNYLRAPAADTTLAFAWTLPVGRFAIGLDPISVIFLIPIFVIAALGSIYGLAYWSPAKNPGNGRKLRLCWGLLAAGMAMVVLARDGVLFLMAWELMALAAYLLITTQDYKRGVRQAGWVYLVATHTGTLCLFAFFALLQLATGSMRLWGMLPVLSDPMLTMMFVLALVGFGLKAGLLPLHVWLPGAHANAPSHVSAVLSGVMLKMGIYGLVRVTALVPQPPLWWGGLLLAAGCVSALVGIAFAVAQQDFKRLLAYSSIENIGIILMGLGLAVLGRSTGRIDWLVLGLGGALLHVLNHSLFKPLLFLGAGSVLHGAHTRRIDRLGGLAGRMPRTFGLFVLGSLAICGLPPLNGFISEIFIYIGLLQTLRAGAPAAAWIALAVPALATVGALAVMGFVKLLGGVFGGAARSPAARHAHDPAGAMLLPMVLLALGCVAIGLLPFIVIPVIEPAIGCWAQVSVAGAIGRNVPLQTLSICGLSGLVLLLLVVLPALQWVNRRVRARVGTWDCGYAAPSARMQYTGSSFSQALVELLGWVLFPKVAAVGLRRTVFPPPRHFSSQVPDTVLDRAVIPAFAGVRRLVLAVRSFQHGSLPAYLVYVLLILVVLMFLA